MTSQVERFNDPTQFMADTILDNFKIEMGIRYDKDVAKMIDVKSSDIGNWRRRGIIPSFHLNKLNRLNNKNDIGEIQMERVTTNPMDNQYKYIAELQSDKIDSLTSEVEVLKEALDQKQAESTHWEELPFDFISEVTLQRKGLSFGRTVDSVSDLDRLSEALGYSVSELENLWSIGAFYNFKEHPIDKIVAKETLKEIEKQMTTLPYIFDSIKSMVGDHYIPQPLVYIHKNGDHIGAIAFAKVQWRTLKVTAKVQFINHMPKASD